MMDVHTKGKAVVSSGTRDEAERDVARLHAHGSVGHDAAAMSELEMPLTRDGEAVRAASVERRT